MKKTGLFVITLVSSIFLIVVFGFSAPAAAEDSSALVTIEGSSFSPEVVTIKAGGEVVWKNKDAAAHTVTADDGSFDSGSLGQGDEFKQKFPSAGTITYSCDNHAWMKGKIEVR
jgi:plastocyanin